MELTPKQREYWQRNLKLTATLLIIWFLVTYVVIWFARELNEELGVCLDANSAIRIGEFEDVAVNEPGHRVRAQAYFCSVEGTPSPKAEIEELAWVDPAGPYHVTVAPLSAKHILPAYLALTGNVAAEER